MKQIFISLLNFSNLIIFTFDLVSCASNQQRFKFSCNSKQIQKYRETGSDVLDDLDQAIENIKFDSQSSQIEKNSSEIPKKQKVKTLKAPPGFKNHNHPYFEERADKMTSQNCFDAKSSYFDSSSYTNRVRFNNFQASHPEKTEIHTLSHSNTDKFYNFTNPKEQEHGEVEYTHPEQTEFYNFTDTKKKKSNTSYSKEAANSDSYNVYGGETNIKRSNAQSDLYHSSMENKIAKFTYFFHPVGYSSTDTSFYVPVNPQSVKSVENLKLPTRSCTQIPQTNPLLNPTPSAIQRPCSPSKLLKQPIPIRPQENFEKQFSKPLEIAINEISNSNIISNLFEAVLNCLFSVPKFVEYINLHAEKVPSYKKLKNLNFYMNNDRSQFNSNAYKFLSRFWQFDKPIEQEESHSNCYYFLKKLMHYIFHTARCQKFEDTFPFLIEIQKYKKLSPLGDFQFVRSEDVCIFRSDYLKKVPEIFPDNVICNSISSMASFSYSFLDFEVRKFQVYRCQNAIILQCWSQLFVTGCPKLEFFNRKVLRNGLIHRHMGVLRVKSGIFYNTKDFTQKYTSVFSDQYGNWYVQNDCSKFKVDIIDWATQTHLVLAFMFLEIEGPNHTS